MHLDWRNKVVGVSISAGVPTKTQKTGGKDKMDTYEIKPPEDPLEATEGLKSRVIIQPMEMGPQPDTAAFIQRIEQEKLAKERGETKDNRSFFAK